MERMPSFDLRLPSLALALAALTACAAHNEVAQPCPSFGVLNEADDLTAFGASGQSATDIAYHVGITDTTLTCDYKLTSKRERRRRRSEDSESKIMGPLGDESHKGRMPRGDDDSDSGGDDSGNADQGMPQRSLDNATVNATFKVSINVSPGPAFNDAPVTVPYFVAIARGGKFILAREEFTETIRPGRHASVTERKEIPVSIPLAKDMTGASYQVIVGLVLTPDQLAYNRKQQTH